MLAVAFTRQDDALLGSTDLAVSKAVAARIFDKPASLLAQLARPGAPLFGIQETNAGRVVMFGGGRWAFYRRQTSAVSEPHSRF